MVSQPMNTAENGLSEKTALTSVFNEGNNSWGVLHETVAETEGPLLKDYCVVYGFSVFLEFWVRSYGRVLLPDSQYPCRHIVTSSDLILKPYFHYNTWHGFRPVQPVAISLHRISLIRVKELAESVLKCTLLSNSFSVPSDPLPRFVRPGTRGKYTSSVRGSQWPLVIR